MKKLYLTLSFAFFIICAGQAQSYTGKRTYTQVHNSLQSHESLHPATIEPGSSVQYCSQSHKTAPILHPMADNTGYDMKHLIMNLDIDPAVVFISGSVIHTFEVKKDILSIEMELSTDFIIDSIVYDAQNLDYIHSQPYNLAITFPGILETGSMESIEIFYHGIPSSAQGFGSVGYELHDGVPAMWTLSEPYGARDWWPGKNDLTDKIDSIDVIVNCPEEFRAASNGLLIQDIVEDGTRINHWKHKYPIVPYLVAVAVTNYAVYTDTAYSQGEMVPILNYVYPETLQLTQQDTKNTIPVMELFSDLFGEYPFIEEKYGHAQFGWGGGMEHQTMSFMGVFHYEIIAHELAHQWFGDMVTLNSWQDIWLNEGFATYLAGLSYEHLFEGVYWPIWKEWNLESVVSQPGGSVFVTDTADVNRIFSSRLSYSKGALVLHSLRWVIGDDAFFEACNNYLDDARYNFASTDMLKQHMEATSGMDLTEFFNDWYYGEGYPSYTLYYNRNENDEYVIKLNQVTSHPSVDFFEMPVPVKFSGEGQDTIIVFDHNTNNQEYVINPGFTISDVDFDPEQWLISANNQILLDTVDPTIFEAIKIYPNPAENKIRIDAGNRKGDLYVSDVAGRIVSIVKDFDQLNWIDISGLDNGTYFIKILDKRAPADLPFIKVK